MASRETLQIDPNQVHFWVVLLWAREWVCLAVHTVESVSRASTPKAISKATVLTGRDARVGVARQGLLVVSGARVRGDDFEIVKEALPRPAGTADVAHVSAS